MILQVLGNTPLFFKKNNIYFSGCVLGRALENFLEKRKPYFSLNTESGCEDPIILTPLCQEYLREPNIW